MKVIAIEVGYDGLVVRSPETVDGHGKPLPFDMPDDAYGSWYRPLDAKGNVVPCDAKGRPLAAEVKAKAKKDEKAESELA